MNSSGSRNPSSSIVLDNVDDYLAPSQACINPLFQPSSGSQPNEASTKKPTTDAEAPAVVPRRRRRVVRRPVVPVVGEGDEEEGSMSATNTNGSTQTRNGEDSTKGDAVKASMADCLACSGCVTTAETVLMEQHHSLTSLRQRLEKQEQEQAVGGGRTKEQHTKHRRRALTLSPNSLADLCRHWNLAPRHVPHLVVLLHQIVHVNLVVNGNIPLEWTWRDEAREFVQLYRRSKQEKSKSQPQPVSTYGSLSTPPPSMAMDATRTMYYLPDGTTPVVTNQTRIAASSSTPKIGKENADPIVEDDPYAPSTPHLPVISGSCPALVCLVEKNMHQLVPHLSRTLSPMTRLGWVLKTQSNEDWDHWAVMPCHDKKLEASRKDFEMMKKENGDVVPTVDLVITTMELVELVDEWRLESMAGGSATSATAEARPSMHEYLESLPAADLGKSSDLGNDSKSVQEIHQQLDRSHVLYWTNQTWDNPSSIPSSDKTIALASGGHADYIFRYAARELFGYAIPTEQPIQWEVANTSALSTGTKNGSVVKSLRLANQQKKQQSYCASLYRQTDGTLSQSPGPELVLQFGIVRGMQTMQRALNELTTTNSSSGGGGSESNHQLDYLEAMACPHGCINGGGSVRTNPSAAASSSSSSSSSSATAVLVKETPSETKARVDKTLQELVVPAPLLEWKVGASFDAKDHDRYQTRYHVVPQMHHTMGAAAGVKVQDMQW